MYFFAATTQPIRMPGACNPFVAAPDTNTLELLISSINCSELIGGVWKNSYASSLREKGEEYAPLAEKLDAMPVHGASKDVFPLIKVFLVDMGIFTYSSFNPIKKFFIPPIPTATAIDMETVQGDQKTKEQFIKMFTSS